MKLRFLVYCSGYDRKEDDEVDEEDNPIKQEIATHSKIFFSDGSRCGLEIGLSNNGFGCS